MLRNLIVAALAAASLTDGANAVISFNPNSVPVPPSWFRNGLAPNGDLGDKFKDFGVDFTWGGVEGAYYDIFGKGSFAGVNASGMLDNLSNIDGRIVLPGTLTGATTDYFYVEANASWFSSLKLTLYDTSMNVLAVVDNEWFAAVSGPTFFTYSGPGIAYFSISTPGHYYTVSEIRLNDPVGSVAANAAVPEPATWAMMIAGFGLVGFAARRRNPVAA
ncbi:PEPxxWA-CTERM sorting domain-containing protein [Sandaracinobacteroides saxicola]|uniref:PEPxxWA-CTERM sorting domain-containing protein n=1 Tax=Sandaracinobacteroides saxicola TaxID=2759707 RepID=UPI001FB149D7|nr:PEPxxWA-CTERM sorting domain-containing protein [Sandaracinobacteroides saxicola]